MFRQDYRINKIFLLLRGKIKSIRLILSENILALCLIDYELISKYKEILVYDNKRKNISGNQRRSVAG